jgi:hypothetical protein
MGFSLPSGVVNTDSVYFYADGTYTLGPFVKELVDQTLVIIDYSKITPSIVINSYSFAIDVTSNPALVVAYPQLSSTGLVLTFLLSGGIAGQQYNLTIDIDTNSGSQSDVLTISIPSFDSCSCDKINPVPTIYSQVPLGEPTQGYANTAVRFFWGNAAPANPNVSDQWYNPSTQIFYEWITDGINMFWETISSANLITEAPSTGLVYGRYNGNWLPVTIQWDAPADGGMYTRRNNAWYSMPQYVSEAPGMSIRFGRYNGTWQPDAIQTDAPNDGNVYARFNNGWQQLPPYIVEAPQNSLLYARINSNWQSVPIQADAPPDGQFYARRNYAWFPVEFANLLSDAPTDGTLYGRQDAAWIAAYPASNPANYQSDTQVAASLTPYAKWQGGTFTGACSFPGVIMPNGPATLQINGGATGQILVRNSIGTMAWNDPSPPEAPLDGVAYARQNGGWVPTASGAGIAEAPQDGTSYSRNNATWVHLAHTDITDWDATINSALAPYALLTNVPLGSTTFPLMDGTNAIGTSLNWARADHVHPTDTSRYAASNPSNYQTAAQVTAALGPYALTSAVPVASNALPTMDSAAAAGSSVAFSRADHVHPSDTSRLALAGGTMTGLLVLASDPTANLQAATKQYVDNSIVNANIDCGTF